MAFKGTIAGFVVFANALSLLLIYICPRGCHCRGHRKDVIKRNRDSEGEGIMEENGEKLSVSEETITECK